MTSERHRRTRAARDVAVETLQLTAAFERQELPSAI